MKRNGKDVILSENSTVIIKTSDGKIIHAKGCKKISVVSTTIFNTTNIFIFTCIYRFLFLGKSAKITAEKLKQDFLIYVYSDYFFITCLYIKYLNML